jgi:hypothetical protein
MASLPVPVGMGSKVDGGLYSLFGALCPFGRKPKSHPYGQGGGKPKRIDIFFREGRDSNPWDIKNIRCLSKAMP